MVKWGVLRGLALYRAICQHVINALRKGKNVLNFLLWGPSGFIFAFLLMRSRQLIWSNRLMRLTPNMKYHQLTEARASQVALVAKKLPANAGDLRNLIPGWGRCPGGGNGNPFQYSYLENPMDRGAYRATIYGVKKSWTWNDLARRYATENNLLSMCLLYSHQALLFYGIKLKIYIYESLNY